MTAMELLPIVRGIHIGATVLLAGAPAFELLILRRANWTSYALAALRVREWLRLPCIIGLIVAVLSWGAWLAVLAINMSGLPASEALTGTVLWKVVTRTTFGHAWSVRLILFAIMAALLAATRAAPVESSRLNHCLAAVVSVGVVVGLAWTGHAAGAHSAHSAHLAVDAVHLLAAATWLGMIPPLWLIVRRAGVNRDWCGLAVASAHYFFWPGAISVALVAASGIANATWLVGSVAHLWTTRYGILLLSKVGLFLVMLGLAAANRWLTRRAARELDLGDQQRAVRALRETMKLELICGTLVLGVVALLGVTPPATHEHAMHEMQMEHHR